MLMRKVITFKVAIVYVSKDPMELTRAINTGIFIMSTVMIEWSVVRTISDA